jgi:hypothetical protein
MKSAAAIRLPVLPMAALASVAPGALAARLIAALLAGAALVVATMELGSGDYGQWLMAARPYLGLDIPSYRAAATVPPLVPAVLALVQQLTGDPVAALRLLLALLVAGLGGAAALAGAAFFRNAVAALLAAAGCLLLSDRFLDLFAFGGLLQIAAVGFLVAAVAALQRAPDSAHSWRWWLAGAFFAGLGALSHVGTAALLVAAVAAVALLSVLRLELPWRQRVARLAPLAVALALVGAYWLVVLLPGAADLAGNPASLQYRGPDRLAGALLEHPPTALIMLVGGACLLAGAVGELRARRLGPWLALLAWTATSLAALGAAIVDGAATDYPRFATPLLAPLVVAAAGAAKLAIDRVAARLAPLSPVTTQQVLALMIATAVVVVAAPLAVAGFRGSVAGYRLADMHGLQQAASWVDHNLPADVTVLATAREAKWVEGLTGRAALFSNPIRYSFRPAEWQRSLAADTLLRGNSALVNEFFFVRFVDGDAAAVAPRQLAIAANHGGEFVDLFSTVPATTAVLGPAGETVATLGNMQSADRRDLAAADELTVGLSWTAERRGEPIELRQTTVLRRDASTLELRAGVTSSYPVSGFQFDLRPALPLVSVTPAGSSVEATFAALGSTAPTVRLGVARGDASITALPDGQGLRVAVIGTEVRLLVTALTAASSPSIGLRALAPAELVEQYGVGAVLLRVDPSFPARRDRLAALGFEVAHTFGSYALLLSK